MKPDTDLNGLGINYGAFTRGRKDYRYLALLFFSGILVSLTVSSVYAQKLFVKGQEYSFRWEEHIAPSYSLFTDINADSQNDLIVAYRHPGDVARTLQAEAERQTLLSSRI